MNIDKIKALEPTRVIVLDTETTGLHAEGTDEILSLTIIDLNGTVLFNELVKPEKRKRWPKAQEVHGITPAMVKDKKPLSAYREQLQELWKRIDLVVGYNIEFDSDFIYSSGLALNPYVTEFDVMREFAPIYGKWDEYHNDYKWVNLSTCAKYYKVGDFEAHTSLGDTEATRQCFLALLNDEDYVSGKRAMEGFRAKVSAKYAPESAKKPTKAVVQKASKDNRDAIGKLLTLLLIVFAFLAVINLLIEWQMGVAYLFAFVLIVVLKGFHDAKVRNE